MNLFSWLRERINAGHSDQRGQGRRRAAKSRPAARSRPRLELLEHRTLLSGVTFSPPVSYGVGLFPTSVAVADFNGDGKPDLAVANYFSNSVSLLFGNGDGTFLAAQNIGPMYGPTWVAVADFNGDGRPDLAVATVFGSSSVLLGNGDGTFQDAQN